MVIGIGQAYYKEVANTKVLFMSSSTFFGTIAEAPPEEHFLLRSTYLVCRDMMDDRVLGLALVNVPAQKYLLHANFPSHYT